MLKQNYPLTIYFNFFNKMTQKSFKSIIVAMHYCTLKMKMSEMFSKDDFLIKPQKL